MEPGERRSELRVDVFMCCYAGALSTADMPVRVTRRNVAEPLLAGLSGFRLAGTEDGRERQCGWSRGEAILSESVARELPRPYSSAQQGHRHTARRRSS